MKHLILITLISYSITGFSQTPPGSRHYEEIAYDIHRNKIIVYGGIQFSLRDVQTYPEDVNDWNGSFWKRFNLPSPGNRIRHALIYHPEDRVTLLIGGNSYSSRDNTFVPNQEVWQWEEEDWKLLNTACPLKSIEATYDPISKRVLVYGNANIASTNKADERHELWEYKSGRWKKLSAEGPYITETFEMAFDSKRKSLVIPAWENGTSVVWEWKNEQWQKIMCKENCPDYRYYFSLAYHKGDNMTYMYSGRSNESLFLNDFWKWDGKKWVRIEPEQAPSKRCATTMEYAEDALVLYGGVAEWGPTNEMWQWKNGRWKLLNGEYALNATRKIDSLEQLTIAYPTDAGIARQYGSMLQVFKQFSKSESAYKKALSLNPADHFTVYELLKVLYEQNKDTEAEQYISDAIASGHMSHKSFNRVGVFLCWNEKYRQGVRFLEKATQLQPEGNYFYDLDSAYAQMNNADKAFESLNKAFEHGYNVKTKYESDANLESLKSDVR